MINAIGRTSSLILVLVMLTGCSSHHLPAWQITATQKPLLQVKQVNTPLGGTNYVMCNNCVGYSKLSTQNSQKHTSTLKKES